MLSRLAQETRSTTPVGAINRVDNEGDRDLSNRTGTQHVTIFTYRDNPLVWWTKKRLKPDIHWIQAE
jgi:hypothetical protein